MITTFESYRKESYENKKIIIVDIQPSYRIHMNMDMTDFTYWLNHHDYLNILYLYNGPEFGYEDENEIKEWLYDYGLDDTRNIKFFEKNYGFFRDMMDCGATDQEIIKLGKYMIKNNIHGTYEIKEKVPDVRDKWLNSNNYGIYIPDLQDILLNFLDKGDKPLLIGGGQHECFKEVLLLLQMNDIKWDEESQFIW